MEDYMLTRQLFEEIVDGAEVEKVLEEVRTWLKEEKDARSLNCRIEKLSILMQKGFVSLEDANDAWALSRPDGSKDAV